MIQIVLKRTADRQADDFVIEDFAKGSLSSPTERVSVRRDPRTRGGLAPGQGKVSSCSAGSTASVMIPMSARPSAMVRTISRLGRSLEFNVNIRVRRQERGERVRQQFGDSDGIRKQPYMTSRNPFA